MRELRFEELADRLKARHYSGGVIEAGIERARRLVREEELREKSEDDDKI